MIRRSNCVGLWPFLLFVVGAPWLTPWARVVTASGLFAESLVGPVPTGQNVVLIQPIEDHGRWFSRGVNVRARKRTAGWNRPYVLFVPAVSDSQLISYRIRNQSRFAGRFEVVAVA